MTKKLKKNKININKIFSKKEHRKKLIIYITLRILVIICMIAEILHGDLNNVLLCILTLILFTLPDFISNKFEVDLPDTLEIITYLFIFAAEILGEIQRFFLIFPYWDTMLHTLNGFLQAAIGFSLVDILNKNDSRINMTPGFVALVAFTFSMTVGVVWEFVEFGADHYFYQDMQKDRIVSTISSVKINPTGENVPVVLKDITKTIIYSNNGNEITTIDNGYLDIGIIDTMKDLIVNFVEAIVFSILGYMYIINRDGYKFLENILPKKKVKEIS